MDWYLLLKFLHVTAVIIWLGSGFVHVLLGQIASRTNDNKAFEQVIDNIVYLTPRLLIPSAVAALAFGALTAYEGSWYGSLWVWLGLLGFATTFAIGMLVLGPRSEKLAKLAASEGYTDRVISMGGDLLSIAKFDFTMLFVVVADMVLKPGGTGDWPVLLLFAVVLAGGGVLFLAPVVRKGAPTVAGATP